jgi:hypothetical protein
MIRRHIADALKAALADTPAGFLADPRQAGKSTLAQSLCSGGSGRRYLTFDDAAVGCLPLTIAACGGEPQPQPAGNIDLTRAAHYFEEFETRCRADGRRQPGRRRRRSGAASRAVCR